MTSSLLAAIFFVPAQGSVQKVQIEPRGLGFTLTVSGKPFFVKGAGGDGSKTLLKSLGGNSFRTWGAEELEKSLDEAQKLGLKVTAGIWLGHKEHGFKYDDPKMVAKQFDEARKVILKYRNHSALLMWGLGNEMEGYGEADDPNVWNAVEDIAREAKKLDPNHPTMTVIAEIGGKKIPCINQYCPDIDIVGINSYGGAPSLVDRYLKAGGKKPFVLTEFGPTGQWEVGKTPWGAAMEPTSTQKAAHYRESYERAVLGSNGLCLGAYAFTWGYKQEETATWFGMLLPGGDHVAAADVLTEFWSGKVAGNRCPSIERLDIEGSPQVAPGSTIHVNLRAADAEGDDLKVRWLLVGEARVKGTGGDKEPTPPNYSDAVTEAGISGATVKLPTTPGAYRIFAYVSDGHGGAAVGNVPVNVK